MAKISIIVPVYNVEQYLSCCLDSLLQQTLHDIEILLVDDRGQDGSMAIARRYAAMDSRIRVIENPNNMGLSFSRNAGIRHSTAPYIMFCDSDDAYAPDMCEKMLAGIESGADCAVCSSSAMVESDFSAPVSVAKCHYRVVRSGIRIVGPNEIKKVSVTAWNKIYRRELIEKFNIEFPVGLYFEDSAFWFLYGIVCTRIFYIPEPLYCYRRRGYSITSAAMSTNPERYTDNIQSAIWLFGKLESSGLYERHFEFYWQCFRYFLCSSLQHPGLPEKTVGEIYRIANDFIARCGQNDLLSYELAAIKCKKFHKYKKCKRFVGIPWLKIKNDSSTFVIYVAGVPVWRINNDEKYRKYYLLGLRLMKQGSKPLA